VISNKVRFIREIVDNELIVFKKKRSVLEEELETKKYLKTQGNFDYLTGMPIHSLTQEKIKDLEDKHSAILEKIKLIESTSVKKMLADDIKQI
jgi:DNA topoisomerase-2